MIFEPVAVLELEGSRLVFVEDGTPYHDEKKEEVWELLSFVEEALVDTGGRHEWSVVVSDTGLVYDIIINGCSMGYFAIRSLIRALGLSISQPRLLYHGPMNDPGYKKVKRTKYTLSLFGGFNVD